jgi:hypothetical protein
MLRGLGLIYVSSGHYSRSVGYLAVFVRVALAIVVGFQDIFFGHTGVFGWKLVVNSAALSSPNHGTERLGYPAQQLCRTDSVGGRTFRAFLGVVGSRVSLFSVAYRGTPPARI